MKVIVGGVSPFSSRLCFALCVDLSWTIRQHEKVPQRSIQLKMADAK